MNYANKMHAKAAIIFGEDEMSRQEYQVKNMLNGEQQTVSEELLINILSKIQ